MIPRQRDEPAAFGNSREATLLHLPPGRDDAPPGTVGAIELVRRTGITYRQFDYWVRTGLLTPVGSPTPGTGSSRYFRHQEMHRTAVIKWLLDAGIGLQTCRQVIDELMETGTARLNPTLTVHLPEDL